MEHSIRRDGQRFPLLVLLPAFFAGICFDRSMPVVSTAAWLALAATSCAGWYLLRQRKNALLLLLLAWFSIGGARHHDFWYCFAADDVAHLDLDHEQPVAIRCTLLTAPEASPLAEPDPFATIPLGVQSKFYAFATEIRNRQTWEPASGRIAVRVDGHVLQAFVGDQVEMFGVLSRIPAPLNPGERDRRINERNARTLCRLRVPHPDCLSVLKTNRYSLLRQLGRIRSNGLAILDRYLGKQESLLAGALLLGARDRLARDQIEKFFHTGTIHLLAISGLHIGILAWGFLYLANRMPARRTVLISLMIGTLIYSHVAGLRAPIVRAAVLVELVCFSRLWWRDLSAVNALAGGAMLISMLQPASLVLPGAQFSFLAVATLLWLSTNAQNDTPEPLEKLVLNSRPWWQRQITAVYRNLWQLGIAGGCIWIVALPLGMYCFHLCSPIGLVLNVALSIPITIGLLSGFGLMFSGPILGPMAILCGRICEVSLSIVDRIVQLGHAIPHAYFWVCGSNSVWCATFYLVLLALFLAPKIAFNKRTVVAWLMLWFVLPTAAQRSLAVVHKPERQLQCTFLSVGHGTCTVIEMPDDRVLIYDAGRMGLPNRGVDIVSEFLWSRGISHVDAIVMSHADADHYNLVPGLLQRFSVGEILMTQRMWSHSQGGVVALRGAVERAKISVRHLQANDRIEFGEAMINILHPLAAGVPGSDNANSIVLEIQFQGRKILLPGDLESAGLHDVMAEMPRDVDVLMAPHHGSLRSAPKAFAAWCTPEHIIISAGRKAGDIQLRTLFEETGAIAYHTAHDGAVTVRILFDGTLTVTPFRGVPPQRPQRAENTRLGCRLATLTVAQFDNRIMSQVQIPNKLNGVRRGCRRKLTGANAHRLIRIPQFDIAEQGYDLSIKS